MASISDEARWVQRRAFATLVATYLVKSMREDQAIKRAVHECAHAALAHDQALMTELQKLPLESQQVGRRVYTAMLCTHLGRGANLQDALKHALGEGVRSARAFDAAYPNAPVIDTIAKEAQPQVPGPTASAAAAPQAPVANAEKFAPGIGKFAG